MIASLLAVACPKGGTAERAGSDASGAAPPDGAPTTSAAAAASAAPARSADVMTHASGMAEGKTRDASYGPSPKPEVSVDGAALRARHKARIAADRSPVTLLSVPPGPHAAFDLGQRLCEAVVPKRPPETPVLLKPNLGGFEWFKDPAKHAGDNGIRGRTTDPEFVRGVVRCLKARGHTRIVIAEGWGATHADWERLVRVSGYQAMADEEKTPLVAMDDDGVFDVQGEMPGKPVGISGMEGTHVPTLVMPKVLAEALDHGLFLSLPKIKAHRFGVVSMAVKGMQGTVMLSDAAPFFRQKWRMHRELNPYLEARKRGEDDRAAYVAAIETFAERIADVLEVEAPDAVLAEGAPAMDGDGFQQLWASKESVAIGGTNPILVDRVGAAFLGLWDNDKLAAAIGGHKTSPLLEVAAKRFGVDMASPVVVGSGRALLDAPRPVHFVGMAPFTIHSDDAAPTALGNLALSSPEAGDGGADEAAAAPAGPGLTDRPTAHAAALRPGETIVLDGKDDEAAWSRASAASWDTDYAGERTGIPTTARFLYGGGKLYAFFDVDRTGLHVDRTRSTDVPRPKLYEEDCIELFLTPDRATPRHYYEIELGPFGHHFDIDVNLDAKRSDTMWVSGAHPATTQDPARGKATIEVAIDAPPIAGALSKGASLPLGLFRMEGQKPRAYLAWSPPKTPKPNFHVPEAFGSLMLDP